MDVNNKQVGIIIIVFSVVLFLVMFSVTDRILKANEVLHHGCNLPEGVCPYTGFPSQSMFGYVISAGLFVFGVVMIFTSNKDETKKSQVNMQLKEKIGLLQADEKKIYKEIISAGSMIFQNELIEKTGFSKVKITRILDKLEAKKIVERRRRGMSNVVIVK
jgi:uncharacterized membrane protein